MQSPEGQLGLYLHLARAAQLRRHPLERDKLLVLAAALAAQNGLDYISRYCRKQILQHNPRHLLGRWNSVQDALLNEEFAAYLRQLLRRFPVERCEHMLRSLGIEMARERAVYHSDHEYAAALLGTTPEKLKALYAGPAGAEEIRLARAGDSTSTPPTAGSPPSSQEPFRPLSAENDSPPPANAWIFAAAGLLLGVLLGLALGYALFR